MDVEALKIDRSAARRPARSGRRSPWPVRLIVLAAVAGAVWLFWSPISNLLDQVRLPEVRVMRVVESHPATAGAIRGTAANGHIVAARRAALSADTPGRIVEMNVTEGSVVKKGFVVARLYSEEYAASLRRAEADLEAAQAQVTRAEAEIAARSAEFTQTQKSREAAHELVAEARANHDLAVAQFRRAKDLLERGISSQAEFDAAQAAVDGASAQLRGAKARMRAAESTVDLIQSRVDVAKTDKKVAEASVRVRTAARDLAKATLEKTEVRAPFDGIVVLKDAEVGEVVSPNSQGGSNARGSVCTMVDLDSLEVQAEVPEASLSSVVIGAPTRIFLDAYLGDAYRGRVDRIWPTANRQKGTVEVRVAFDEPDERLRPEMGVRIVFQEGEPADLAETPSEPAMLVPEEAVVELNGSSGVFLLQRDVVEFRPVELGERRAGRVAVRSGLDPGQQIVVNPPLSLQSGDRVRIQQG